MNEVLTNPSNPLKLKLDLLLREAIRDFKSGEAVEIKNAINHYNLMSETLDHLYKINKDNKQ